MGPSDSVTLPVNCVHCGEPVTLQILDVALLAHAEARESEDLPEDYAYEQTWTCPYCQALNSGGFPGRITRVTKGHGPDPTA